MRFSFDDIINNLIAEAVFFVLLGLLTTLLWNPIKNTIKRLKPVIDSKIPHVSCELVFNKSTQLTDVYITNSGGEPAYNVLVFLAELFHVDDGGFSIHSLQGEGIRSGIIGPGSQRKYLNKEVHFDGCNVTSTQEIWVDYENAAGVGFRVIVEPPSPRGSDWWYNPPRRVRYLLPNWAGMHAYKGVNREWSSIREGRSYIKSETKYGRKESYKKRNRW